MAGNNQIIIKKEVKLRVFLDIFYFKNFTGNTHA